MERLAASTQALEIRHQESEVQASSVESLHPIFTEERLSTGVSLDRSKPLTGVIEDLVNSRQDSLLPWGEYMENYLFHKDWGYYTSKAEIGEGVVGAEDEAYDFYTLPEKSDAFGATIGRFSFKMWEAMGEPYQFEIKEMGAGNGTLAHSILSWARRENEDFYKRIKYQIEERSPKLIEIQKRKLDEFGQDKVKFVEKSAIDSDFLETESVDGLILSNELTDAFAIERVTRLNENIVQKYVTIENDHWVEVWGEPTPEVMDYITRNNYIIRAGYEEPINLHAEAWQKTIDRSLRTGGILTIDYGRRGQVGRKNEVAIRTYGWLEGNYVAGQGLESMSAPYSGLGELDMTADVDFSVLESIAKRDGLQVGFSGLQEDFLMRNGFDEEVDRLETLAQEGDLYGAENCHGALVSLEDRFKEFYVLLMVREGVDKNLL